MGRGNLRQDGDGTRGTSGREGQWSEMAAFLLLPSTVARNQNLRANGDLNRGRRDRLVANFWGNS